MNANEITVGKKYAVKVGRNEIEVTVTEKNERGWQVASASGRIFPVNSCERFVNCLEVSEAPTSLERKLTMLDAAAEILRVASYPMSAKELIVAMEDAGIWKSPAGKTPWNSLVSAILKDGKKANPRFQKTGKGMFALAEQGGEPCAN